VCITELICRCISPKFFTAITKSFCKNAKPIWICIPTDYELNNVEFWESLAKCFFQLSKCSNWTNSRCSPLWLIKRRGMAMEELQSCFQIDSQWPDRFAGDPAGAPVTAGAVLRVNLRRPRRTGSMVRYRKLTQRVRC
jgi:hypothetical protein